MASQSPSWKNAIERRSDGPSVVAGGGTTRCNVDTHRSFDHCANRSPTFTRYAPGSGTTPIHSPRLSRSSRPGTRSAYSTVMMP